MRNLHSVTELFPDSGDVHGDADDLLVCRKLFGVDGSEEGPGVLVTAQLREDCLADGDVLVNLGAPGTLLLADLDLLLPVILLLCGGVVQLAGLWRLLCTLLVLCAAEDLTWSLELLLRSLSITARTAPFPTRSLINKLQSINGTRELETGWNANLSVNLDRIKKKLREIEIGF